MVQSTLEFLIVWDKRLDEPSLLPADLGAEGEGEDFKLSHVIFLAEQPLGTRRKTGTRKDSSSRMEYCALKDVGPYACG
jgi:hypothetical protein